MENEEHERPEREYSRSRSRENDDYKQNDDRNGGNDHSQDQPYVEPGSNLYVTKLNLETTEESLREAFSKYGEIVSHSIVREPVTQVSRGFGFVAFKTVEQADQAMEAMNGIVLDGRDIRVEKARRTAGYDKTPGRYLGPPQNSRRRPSSRERGGGGGGFYDRRGPPPRSYHDRDYHRGPPPDRYERDFRGPPPRGPYRGGEERYPPRDYHPGGGGGGGYHHHERDFSRGPPMHHSGGGYRDSRPPMEYARRGPPPQDDYNPEYRRYDERGPPPDDRRGGGGYDPRDSYNGPGGGYGGRPGSGPPPRY